MMQLKSIILYNSSGQKRVLTFKLGEVNIITGDSKTGKSTIINIVDYCMGRTSFNIPSGPIRQSIVWYAIILRIDDREIFIAKPRPAGEGRSSSQVYYQIGNDLEPPDLGDLNAFSDDKALIDILSRRLGIYSNQAGEAAYNQPFEVTLDHTKFYLFQPENYIKNPDALFYRQMDEGVAKHIRTTLPFIVGAVEDDALRLSNEISDIERNLVRLRRDLRESEEMLVARSTGAQSLIEEALGVGLINQAQNINSDEAAYALLRQIISTWQPETFEPLPPNSRISELRNIEQTLREDIFQKQQEVDAVEEFVRHSTGYSTEASQQVARLASIGLFDDDDTVSSICPFCSSPLDHPSTSVNAIKRSLQKLDGELKLVGRERPKLDDYEQTLRAQLAQLFEQKRQAQLNIQALRNEADAAETLSDDRLRVARVVGRISWFIENTSVTPNEIDELRREVQRQEQKIASLQEQLNPLALEERLASILDNINYEMTNLAGTLELEHQYPYKLDAKRLTVTISRPGAPIVMGQNLGSGSNFLGAHLITFLALHKYFIQLQRPVPNFIILDQPSQVYYPNQSYIDSNGKTQTLTGTDRLAVERMFKLFFDYCRELYPQLQIIVLEHVADIDTEEFHQALVEEPWFNGRALVPQDWLS